MWGIFSFSDKIKRKDGAEFNDEIIHGFLVL